MAKKRRDRRPRGAAAASPAAGAAAAASDDDDDAASVASTDFDEAELVTVDDGEEQLAAAMEMVGESRSATRERGIAQLTSVLLSAVCTEAFEGVRETAVYALASGLGRRPSKKEGPLLARALAAVFVTVGPEEEELFQQAAAPLLRALQHGSHAETRAESALALALGAFVCSTEPEGTAAALAALDAVIDAAGTEPAAVVAAALDAWGLLATTQERPAAQAALAANVRRFAALVGHADAGVRVAAGENLALVFELSGSAGASAGDQDQDDEALAQAVERIRELSTESSRRIAKKTRKLQRSAFREILAGVERGEPPAQQLRLHSSEVLLIESWVDAKRLAAFRGCLRGGLQRHLAGNELLRDVFSLGAGAGAGDRMSAVEKRMLLSKNSAVARERDADRAYGRQARDNQRGLFLQDES